MSDRELLELAAKAAGLLPLPEGKELDYTEDGGLMFCGGGECLAWNPLTNDGDALRLAVKLNLMLDGIGRGYMAGHWVATRGDINSCYEPALPDPFAATRRAIVRAAAEIGRATTANSGAPKASREGE